jgi:hypothetical protein
MSKDYDENHDCCDNMEHEGCSCGCEGDCEDFDTVYLMMEDGSEIECNTIGTFITNGKQYIALVPVDEEEVIFYQLEESEEGFELLEIENEDEFETVIDTFYELFADDVENEDEFDEDDEE